MKRHGNFDTRDYRYEYTEPTTGQHMSGILTRASSGRDYIERAKALVDAGKIGVRVVKYRHMREVIWEQGD